MFAQQFFNTPKLKALVSFSDQICLLSVISYWDPRPQTIYFFVSRSKSYFPIDECSFMDIGRWQRFTFVHTLQYIHIVNPKPLIISMKQSAQVSNVTLGPFVLIFLDGNILVTIYILSLISQVLCKQIYNFQHF